MNTRSLTMKWCAALYVMAFVFGVLPVRAAAGEAKFEAILIWGTNDEKPSDPNIKPVSEAVAKKLKDFKWANYYEIARQTVGVGKDDKRVQMSKDCVIVIKVLDKDQVEVTLIGKGKTVATMKKELRKGGGCLVTGGKATNSTGWFIILKQVE